MLKCCFLGFKHAFNFNGCTSRKGYISFFALNTALVIFSFIYIFYLIKNMTGEIDSGYISSFFRVIMIYSIIIIIPSLSLTMRRLNSLNMSKAWCILSIVPYLNVIFMLFLSCNKHVVEDDALLY